MASDENLKRLHPLEIKTLLEFSSAEAVNSATMMKRLSFNVGQANQAASWLEAKGYLKEKERSTRVLHEITDIGSSYAAEGSPEERMIALLKERSPLSMPEISGSLGLENRETGSAFGQLSKEGILSMNSEKKVRLKNDTPSPRMKVLRSLLDKAAENDGVLEEDGLSKEEQEVIRGISKKRGASHSIFKTVEREDVSFELTAEGEKIKKKLQDAGISGDEIGALSANDLSTGAWRGRQFRPYNIQIPPSRVLLGRRNPYCEYLDHVKDTLISFGFEEFDGPLVETEFWNSDALFMPQFHSARDIHDVYHIKEPRHAKQIEQPYLDRVGEAHQNGGDTGSRGWGYTFDRNFTRRLILRSQGTVLSAKQLKKAKIPGKYFGIARCFRYDQVDATHLSDFYQTEGIVLGRDVNMRNLLGMLKMFAEELAGATEVKYVPGYFPFTEPSVEVHIKHPELGWFELGGSGIFRPEVTRPQGIDVPVLAWGLGIDRMALMHLGLNDLRELFSANIENVRLRRRD